MYPLIPAGTSWLGLEDLLGFNPLLPVLVLVNAVANFYKLGA